MQKLAQHLWFDKESSARAVQAMLKMKKLDLAALQAAHDGAA